ncbi:uncharacterized protein WM294_008322 [Sarcoramphus papa]
MTLPDDLRRCSNSSDSPGMRGLVQKELVLLQSALRMASLHGLYGATQCRAPSQHPCPQQLAAFGATLFPSEMMLFPVVVADVFLFCAGTTEVLLSSRVTSTEVSPMDISSAEESSYITLKFQATYLAAEFPGNPYLSMASLYLEHGACPGGQDEVWGVLGRTWWLLRWPVCMVPLASLRKAALQSLKRCLMSGVAAMLLCDLREAVTIAYKHPVEIRSVGPFS